MNIKRLDVLTRLVKRLECIENETIFNEEEKDIRKKNVIKMIQHVLDLTMKDIEAAGDTSER